MKTQAQSQQELSEQKEPQGEQAIEALQKANQRIENILESITDAFVAVDRKWRLTYVNQTAAKLMRKPPEELLGHVGWELFPEAIENGSLL